MFTFGSCCTSPVHAFSLAFTLEYSAIFVRQKQKSTDTLSIKPRDFKPPAGDAVFPSFGWVKTHLFQMQWQISARSFRYLVSLRVLALPISESATAAQSCKPAVSRR